MKKLLALAVAAAVAVPMTAMADATVYGKVRQAVEGYDNGQSGADYTRINDWFSRLGVKGSEDLGNGLKAVYKMEFGVPISNGTTISSRNAYVGLAGGFGTVLIGRHDTPLKMSTGGLDVFSATSGHTSNLWVENFTDRRVDGTVAYISPNMGGLTIAAAIVPAETNAADGLMEGYSIAAMYKNSGLYASVAMENLSEEMVGRDDDWTQLRVGFGYKAANWRVGAAWENEEAGETAPAAGDDFDRDKFQIGGAYNFGNNTVKVKYFDAEEGRSHTNNSVEGEHDGFSVGFDHNFSKRTQAYVMYTDSSFEVGDDISIWAVGLNHSF